MVGLLMVGCTEHVVFQEVAEVPGGSWSRSWKPQFAFDITDTLAQRDIYLDIRHTGDYRFSNIYIFTTLQGPGGHSFTDTVECTLAVPLGSKAKRVRIVPVVVVLVESDIPKVWRIVPADLQVM